MIAALQVVKVSRAVMQTDSSSGLEVLTDRLKKVGSVLLSEGERGGTGSAKREAAFRLNKAGKSVLKVGLLKKSGRLAGGASARILEVSFGEVLLNEFPTVCPA